jgi:phospholipase A-2-activating protein
MGRSQVGDVKHSDLPGMEALGREGKLLNARSAHQLMVGKNDGQVIMVKNNDQVEAYQVSQLFRVRNSS